MHHDHSRHRPRRSVVAPVLVAGVAAAAIVGAAIAVLVLPADDATARDHRAVATLARDNFELKARLGALDARLGALDAHFRDFVKVSRARREALEAELKKAQVDGDVAAAGQVAAFVERQIARLVKVADRTAGRLGAEVAARKAADDRLRADLVALDIRLFEAELAACRPATPPAKPAKPAPPAAAPAPPQPRWQLYRDWCGRPFWLLER